MLHLHDHSWLRSAQRSRLHAAAHCTASCSQLLKAIRSAGQDQVTLIEWPWQAFPTPCLAAPSHGPLQALVPRHPRQDSGLLALKAAIAQLPANSLELTVLDGTPTPSPAGEQRWGGCSVHWRGQPHRSELGALLHSYLWIESSLTSGDDPALAREVLSAGLTVCASDASTTAELLSDGNQGSLLSSRQPSQWTRQLHDALEPSAPPAPLLQFPAAQPSLASVLEQLHQQIQPGLSTESRYC